VDPSTGAAAAELAIGPSGRKIGRSRSKASGDIGRTVTQMPAPPESFHKPRYFGIGEEYRAAVYRLRAGESVSAEAPLAATAVDVCLMIAMQCKSSEKHRINVQIYPLPQILL
jgi:hypothetical protein